MAHSESSDIRLHLTPEQKRAVERLATRDQLSTEEAIIRAVQQALDADGDTSSFPEGTPFHGHDDLLSNLGEGPPDLSTNKNYLDDLGS